MMFVFQKLSLYRKLMKILINIEYVHRAVLPAHSELESEISFGNIKQDSTLILQSLWPLDAGNVSR